MVGTPDIAQLRHLLFGKDYDALLALKEQFEHSDKYSASVANVITEALKLREARDGSLSAALGPTIEQALTQSIGNNPKRFADVLYPVMGPAIRKSINQALSEALATFNQLLEQSLSPRSLRWRFDAWRTGQSYAKIALLRTLVYQVEQVFLIHRESGLLLRHVEAEHATSKDPALVSGMLTAIQDFIADSFSVHQADTLRTLSLGELSVLVEHGPHAVLALVVRGTVPSELHTLLRDTSEAIHQQFAKQFALYQGDSASFAGSDGLLSRCLKAQQQRTEKRTPWLAYTLLAALLGLACYWGYQHYQRQQLLQSTLSALKAEPGIVILDAQPTADGYRLKGLQDPLAHTPAQLIPATTQTQLALDFELKPYLSLDPTLVQARARAAATEAQQTQTANQQAVATLVNAVEAFSFPFESGKADLAALGNTLKQSAQTIKDLMQASKLTQQTVQVSIVGNADEVGDAGTNQQLAASRATNIRAALMGAGVPAFVLGTSTTAQNNTRVAHYRVGLY